MARKKLIRKTQFQRKAKKAPKRAVTRPAPKRAVSKKAVTEADTNAPAPKKKQTKTSFVLSFSAETPAKEVVAAGAAQGIALTEKGVYKTRYLARNKAPKAPKKGVAKPVMAAAKPAPKAPPKAARKPGKRGPGDGSGSAFVRQQPVSMKASEVVAAAAAKGITITAGLVYSVRASAKKSGKAPPSSSTGRRRGRPPSAAKAAPKAVVVAGGSDRERQLVSLALDVGLGRAVELIRDFKSKIDTLY